MNDHTIRGSINAFVSVPLLGSVWVEREDRCHGRSFFDFLGYPSDDDFSRGVTVFAGRWRYVVSPHRTLASARSTRLWSLVSLPMLLAMTTAVVRLHLALSLPIVRGLTTGTRSQVKTIERATNG